MKPKTLSAAELTKQGVTPSHTYKPYKRDPTFSSALSRSTEKTNRFGEVKLTPLKAV